MTRIVQLAGWIGLGIAVWTGAVCCGAESPGDADLNRAYQARTHNDYDSAIELFRRVLAVQPNNAGAHKDLAYTLLKTGENAAARDEFEAALHLNPADETAALEFAFLAFETKKPIEARRTFDRLRRSVSPQTRATAEQAFRNIDTPLAQGIERWKEALAKSINPDDISMFSAHWELAQLAEQRDDLPLAAEQYEICRKLKPQLSEILLILARVWQQLNRAEDARAALIAASRSNESRTAEQALEHLDSRYPYPYEFLNALKLDPQNIALRRELAFLYLAMHKNDDAAQQFEQVLAVDPHDRLARDQLDALRGFKKRPEAVAGSAALSPSPQIDAKTMGEKSLALGYIRDAIKYLRQAHESNPGDLKVTLELARAYNLAKDDASALPLFEAASRADDSQIATQARQAYRNLNSAMLPQTTVWALPMYSSRWNDLFSYGQVKRTLPLPWRSANNLFSFYLSTRFDGDVRGAVPTAYGPGYLSETAAILGLGMASKPWHHLTAWAEAGEALRYLPNTNDTAIPDYRGGLNAARGFGSLLGSRTPGLFYETTADAIYVNRFDKDWLFYSQNRGGRTFKFRDQTVQLLMNLNYSGDVKSQYWANTLEVGPGVRLHLDWMPPGVYLSLDVLRGYYLRDDYLPPCLHDPFPTHNCRAESHYLDVRVGFWFARTR